MTLLTQHALDLSDSDDSAPLFPPCMGGRFARGVRHLIVSAVQRITEMPVLGDRFALWGYETRDTMQSLGLSWVFSIDRSYAMDIGCVARVVVLGESLCIFSRLDPQRAVHAACVDRPHETVQDASLALAGARVSDAFRNAAAQAEAAVRAHGHGRYWCPRPVGW